MTRVFAKTALLQNHPLSPLENSLSSVFETVLSETVFGLSPRIAWPGQSSEGNCGRLCWVKSVGSSVFRHLLKTFPHRRKFYSSRGSPSEGHEPLRSSPRKVASQMGFLEASAGVSSRILRASAEFCWGPRDFPRFSVGSDPTLVTLRNCQRRSGLEI